MNLVVRILAETSQNEATYWLRGGCNEGLAKTRETFVSLPIERSAELIEGLLKCYSSTAMSPHVNRQRE